MNMAGWYDPIVLHYPYCMLAGDVGSKRIAEAQPPSRVRTDRLLVATPVAG